MLTLVSTFDVLRKEHRYHIVTIYSYGPPKPAMKFCNKIPYDVTSKRETISTSKIEVDTSIYLTLLKDMAPLANMKKYSNIDCQASTQMKKIESKYSMTS